jgi:hypothetical protein
LDITPGSHAYHIGFHFLFLLMGYTVRGYRAANQMFLNFASLTGLFITLILIMAFIGRIYAVDGWGFLWEEASTTTFEWSTLLWTMVMIALTIAVVINVIMMQRMIRVVRRYPHLFPQTSHAMV